MMENMSEFTQRKLDMIELWKETFHDSDRYINLVFNAYYSLDNTFVRYEGEKLVAALLGVCYTFLSFDKQGCRKYLKGLYLCGLATRPEWRKKGIMTQLIKEAEKKAEENGYDMTFLIPADANLREYYNKKGYYTSSFRKLYIIERPINLSKSINPKMYIYTIRDFSQHGNYSDFLNELADWCCEIEFSHSYPSILHSKKDMLTIIAENENSIFLTNSMFDPEYPILTQVCAVVFPEFSDNSKRHLRINGFFCKKTKEIENVSSVSDNRFSDIIPLDMINVIFREFKSNSIEFLIPSIGKRDSKEILQPYAMMKKIGENTIFKGNDIPQFEISLMLD